MNAEQKQYWVKTMREHAAADRLIQGTWMQEEKDVDGMHRGCFFGCAMQTENNAIHKAAEAMGVPENILHLAERIFEGLPIKEAVEWPVQFLSAVPVVADLSNVKHFVAIKRMECLLDLHKDLGEKYGLLDAIRLTIEYHKTPTESARSAAAESAARSAESAAESAAWSAESAAWAAARSAARSAAWAAAESSAWQQERDALLNTLQEI